MTTNPNGRPSGLASILQDMSECFEAEDRVEAMFRANSALVVIWRLSNPRHVKVNQGFLHLMVYAGDVVLGRSFHEIHRPAGAEHRRLAVDHPHAGKPSRGGKPA